jgi:hypothetical protein
MPIKANKKKRKKQIKQMIRTATCSFDFKFAIFLSIKIQILSHLINIKIKVLSIKIYSKEY